MPPARNFRVPLRAASSAPASLPRSAPGRPALQSPLYDYLPPAPSPPVVSTPRSRPVAHYTAADNLNLRSGPRWDIPSALAKDQYVPAGAIIHRQRLCPRRWLRDRFVLPPYSREIAMSQTYSLATLHMISSNIGRSA